MKNGWSLERKARQAALIKTWRPWEKSTGPRSEAGKSVSSQNGLKRDPKYRQLDVIRRQVHDLMRDAVTLQKVLSK